MVGSFLEYFLRSFFGRVFFGRIFWRGFFGEGFWEGFFWGGICLRNSLFIFGCSTAAAELQMALNFELVISDQLFSIVLASCK